VNTLTGSTTARRRALVACLLMAALHAVVVPPHAQSQVDQKRAEAEALRSRIADQGRTLSLADEQFNQARLERQRIEGQAASARNMVKAADDRWTALRTQLGERVRLLYKHPGAAIDAWLGARSVSQLARAHKLGSTIVGADAELVLQTERARHEVMTRARRLEGIRDNAQAKEQELASRRTQVASAVSEQKALLGDVTAEIADLIEAQRRREIEQARLAQAQQSGGGTSTAPVIGDGEGQDEDEDEAPPPEPTGPPPPVKSGAAKAVQTAAAQMGKPYEWAAEGPDSYDCSGLTMYAWQSAGVSLPHSSQAQYSSLPHVARGQLRPGDLVFYGSPIHHVGIYEGGGVMINAPETGENVRRDSINRADWAGAARP
jgi:cell wall-associated NlpC family hydrolase